MISWYVSSLDFFSFFCLAVYCSRNGVVCFVVSHNLDFTAHISVYITSLSIYLVLSVNWKLTQKSWSDAGFCFAIFGEMTSWVLGYASIRRCIICCCFYSFLWYYQLLGFCLVPLIHPRLQNNAFLTPLFFLHLWSEILNKREVLSTTVWLPWSPGHKRQAR